MRRVLGIVLIGLGVCLLTLGVLLHSYVYPGVAKVAADLDRGTDPGLPAVVAAAKAVGRPAPDAAKLVAEGSGVKVLVVRQDSIAVRTLDQVTATRTVLGDPTRASGDHVFWEMSTEVTSPQVSGPILTSVVGVCLNRVTGLAGNGCRGRGYLSEKKDENVDLDRRGLYFKFPFNAQKHAYEVWDDVIKTTAPANYVGTEELGGLPVYKYVQTIPDTDAGTQPEVPATLFNGPPTLIEAKVRYANTTTFWVEPETGVIIKGSQDENRRLVYNGQEVPVLAGELTFNQPTVSIEIATQQDNASKLHQLRVLFPLLAGIGGVLLLLAGLGITFLLPWWRERFGSGDTTAGSGGSTGQRDSSRRGDGRGASPDTDEIDLRALDAPGVKRADAHPPRGTSLRGKPTGVHSAAGMPAADRPRFDPLGSGRAVLPDE